MRPTNSFGVYALDFYGNIDIILRFALSEGAGNTRRELTSDADRDSIEG